MSDHLEEARCLLIGAKNAAQKQAASNPDIIPGDFLYTVDQAAQLAIAHTLAELVEQQKEQIELLTCIYEHLRGWPQ